MTFRLGSHVMSLLGESSNLTRRLISVGMCLCAPVSDSTSNIHNGHYEKWLPCKTIHRAWVGKMKQGSLSCTLNLKIL